jgi:hypothetical protein
LANEALPQMRGSRRAIQNRFIALLKPPFKSSEDYHVSIGAKIPDEDFG